MYKMTKRRSLPALALACALVATSGASQAVTWSDTFVGYRHGSEFHEPNNPRDVEKHIVQFSHASGYTMGQNFINLDIFRSDEADPTVRGGDKGATEFYLVYRHQLHLGKALGKRFAFGPVKELALTAGFDLNTKDSPVQPRKRVLVAGPTLKFDVPGVLDVSLLFGREWNQNKLGSPKQRGTVPGQTPREATAILADELAAIAPFAAERGSPILLEALSSDQTNVVNLLAEVEAIVGRVGQRGGVDGMFDFHNCSDEASPHAALIDRYIGMIRHVHLNDPRGDPPQPGDMSYLPAFARLRELRYDG